MNVDIVNAMIDGCPSGSELAKSMGLNPRYFYHNKNSDSLNKCFEILQFKNVLLVRISNDIREYFKNYCYVAIPSSADEQDFLFTIPLTNKMKIGFWK